MKTITRVADRHHILRSGTIATRLREGGPIVSTSRHDPLIEIRLEGESVGAGRISIEHVLCLLGEFRKALLRTGAVLMGHADSARRGQKPRCLQDEISLDLVGISHGSPATVLTLTPACPQIAIPETDFGREVLLTSIRGLEAVQGDAEDLPLGFDRGVLSAWRDFGKLFDRGVADIKISLNGETGPLETHYTLRGYHRVQQRIVGQKVNVRTVEGRLLMADFKEHGTRCRIHPSVGDPILCLFDEEQKEEVLENILHYVRVVGEAVEDPLTNRIASIRIVDIQRIEDRDEETDGLVPVGTPIPTDFWRSPSIEDLADAQGVRPLGDVRVLFGTWPGADDDGFEEMVHELRRRGLDGGSVC